MSQYDRYLAQQNQQMAQARQLQALGGSFSTGGAGIDFGLGQFSGHGYRIEPEEDKNTLLLLEDLE